MKKSSKYLSPPDLGVLGYEIKDRRGVGGGYGFLDETSSLFSNVEGIFLPRMAYYVHRHA